VEIGLAPQAVCLPSLVRDIAGGAVIAVAQNCGPAESGAFTGEISPKTLKEIGVEWVLLGHSERRQVAGETPEYITKKCLAARSQGLKIIFCVGETLEQRKAGKTFSVLQKQLEEFSGPFAPESAVVAYEPVWAIGTGETATPKQAAEVHAFIRQAIGNQACRILYGGSVKPELSKALMAEAEIDGLLVGGASLDANGFAEIILNGLGSGV
jgi:triosephosphate isomerase